ncbi:MAG: fused MFS/spermidine synthase [Pseudomonadota bacterium]
MVKSKNLELLDFESPWECQPGKVRVMQAAEGASRDELSKRAWRNELTQPYIFETLFERRMHFTNDATQSAMLLSDPDALIAEYTRKMMAFLLFNPIPRRIVMIGLGGGSLAKFCYRHLPQSRITVVEINHDVIALREEFCIPKDDERFAVVHDDGARYVEQLDEQMDVLLIDAFDADGIALSLAKSDFYSCAARKLTEHGMLVMNFWGSCERYVDNLGQARAAFGDSLLLVPVSGDVNVLLFAFKQAPPQSITDDLEALARRLQMRLSLDFPRYLRRICQGHTLSDSRVSIETEVAAAFCLPVHPTARESGPTALKNPSRVEA